MKLLHIDSSPLRGDSVSRQLTQATVAQWRATHPQTKVEYLDLATEAPTHLSVESLGFRLGANGAELSELQKRENEISERLVAQFLDADVVVVGAPMYNFTIPSQLKAWIDRVAQAGRTFRYTAAGPEGLAGGRTVIIASSRGGMYSANPAMDHQEAYLRTIFGFFGVTDIRVVRAEGQSMGAEAKAAGLSAARSDILAHTTRAADQAPATVAG